MQILLLGLLLPFLISALLNSNCLHPGNRLMWSQFKLMEDSSIARNMQRNADKCKVMVIIFKTKKHVFRPLLLNGCKLETVDSAMILGVTISSNLKWNDVIESIKKAKKCFYFPVLLRRARVPAKDIMNFFFCTAIRPVLEYSAQIFHHALPVYLNDDLERVQRRALSIIFPELSHHDSLGRFGFAALYDRRLSLCEKLFLTISSPSHKLSILLPDGHIGSYNMRRPHVYNAPRFCTDRSR